MKKYLLVILFLCFVVSEGFAQFAVKVRTDKTEYQYGEPITIMVDVINKSDSTKIIISGSTHTRQAGFFFSGYDSQKYEMCFCTVEEILFPPRSTRTYKWKIVPSESGFPQKNGEQLIVGYMRQLPNLYDTIKIKAPKYLGGIISASYSKINENNVLPVWDSLKAIKKNVYEFDGKLYGTWIIKDYSLDSAVAKYGSDKRFNWFQAMYLDSLWSSITTTEIKQEHVVPTEFWLYDAYPNPFNPTTTISYSIPVETRHASSLQYVTLKVHDMLGREIATLVDELKSPGLYSITFNTLSSSLTSGVYFYTFHAGDFVQTKKMLLLK